MDSRKLATDEIITRTSADIAVGVDLDQGLYGDEGKYRLKHTPKRDLQTMSLPALLFNSFKDL